MDIEKLTKTQIVLLTLLISFVTSLATGIVTVALMSQAPPSVSQTINRFVDQTVEKIVPGDPVRETEIVIVTEEDLVVRAVKEALPAVVSVIATKDLPVFEEVLTNPFEGDPFLEGFGLDFRVPQYQQKGTEERQVSSGTGFLVSSDGILATNKHVVEDVDANYSVILSDGQGFSATVLARDPTQDIAILKIDQDEGNQKKFSYAKLGNSDKINIGQSVIAIGNTLGEFQNSVSVGIISGLDREIVASGGLAGEERLSEVIQTDAAINPGNSGGPLLNLEGEVIGINTAIAASAENVGFALPINIIKRAVADAKEFGEIRYAYLGVRYLAINEQIKEERGLPVNYGALIIPGDGPNSPGVIEDSPASEAGLGEGDIIIEFGGEKINSTNSLGLLISKRRVGDTVSLKVLKGP